MLSPMLRRALWLFIIGLGALMVLPGTAQAQEDPPPSGGCTGRRDCGFPCVPIGTFRPKPPWK